MWFDVSADILDPRIIATGEVGIHVRVFALTKGIAIMRAQKCFLSYCHMWGIGSWGITKVEVVA